jgi:hypothetical protein
VPLPTADHLIAHELRLRRAERGSGEHRPIQSGAWKRSWKLLERAASSSREAGRRRNSRDVMQNRGNIANAKGVIRDGQREGVGSSA